MEYEGSKQCDQNFFEKYKDWSEPEAWMPIGWCLAQTRHGCDAYSLFTPKFGKKNAGTQSF